MSGQTSGMFESVAHHSSFVHVYFQPRVLSELLLPGAWCTLMAGAPLMLKPALEAGADTLTDFRFSFDGTPAPMRLSTKSPLRARGAGAEDMAFNFDFWLCLLALV